MNDKTEIKDNKEVESKINENIIGILLIMPIFIPISIILNILKLNTNLLTMIVRFLPVILGIVLSNKLYKDRINKLISQCIYIFLGLSIYFMYEATFGIYSGWGGLGVFFQYIISSFIAKVFIFIFYGKIVGKKKAIIFFITYVLILISIYIIMYFT